MCQDLTAGSRGSRRGSSSSARYSSSSPKSFLTFLPMKLAKIEPSGVADGDDCKREGSVPCQDVRHVAALDHAHRHQIWARQKELHRQAVASMRRQHKGIENEERLRHGQ